MVTNLPLLGCLDGPISTATSQVKYDRRGFRELVYGQALAAVHKEHVVPVVTERISIRPASG